MAERLLEVKGLKTHFFTDEGVVRAVDGTTASGSAVSSIASPGNSPAACASARRSVGRCWPIPNCC